MKNIKTFEGFTDWFKPKSDPKKEIEKTPDETENFKKISQKVLIELNKCGYHMRPFNPSAFMSKGSTIPLSTKKAPYDWMPFSILLDGSSWNSGLVIYFKNENGNISYVKHKFRDDELKDEEYAQKLISKIKELYEKCK